jgi:four helix bundle protein
LERLDVWRKAKDFAKEVYSTLGGLPAEEKWGLNSQLRKAAQSVPANIAEGVGRFYYQETISFCYIARGSLEETISHLILTHELGYLSEDRFKKMMQDSDALLQLINGYIAYLKRTRIGESEPGAHVVKEAGFEYDSNPDPLDLSSIE